MAISFVLLLKWLLDHPLPTIVLCGFADCSLHFTPPTVADKHAPVTAAPTITSDPSTKSAQGYAPTTFRARPMRTPNGITTRRTKVSYGIDDIEPSERGQYVKDCDSVCAQGLISQQQRDEFLNPMYWKPKKEADLNEYYDLIHKRGEFCPDYLNSEKCLAKKRAEMKKDVSIKPANTSEPTETATGPFTSTAFVLEPKKNRTILEPKRNGTNASTGATNKPTAMKQDRSVGSIPIGGPTETKERPSVHFDSASEQQQTSSASTQSQPKRRSGSPAEASRTESSTKASTGTPVLVSGRVVAELRRSVWRAVALAARVSVTNELNDGGAARSECITFALL